MQNTILVLALSLVLAPVMASAQPGPGPGGPGGPPPEVRAKFEQFRTDAKTNIWKALSADHQAKIQTIVDGFNGGTIALQDAVSQIDALLTPDETKAVLDQERTMREAMRAAFLGANSAPAPGAGPGGSNGDRPAGERREGAGRGNTGRLVLQLFANPEKLRDAMRAMRGAQKPPQ